MKMKDHVNLLQTAHHYYPIGIPHLNEWNSELRKIVSEKVDGSSATTEKWQTLISDLEDEGVIVQNLSFIQFPNLMLEIEHPETINNISICRNFVICLSLLCPYYTYFFEYKQKVRVDEGLLPLASLVFFSKKGFDNLKVPISMVKIENLIQSNFPEYTLINHYELMHSKITGGLPYGMDLHSYANFEFSYYEFLFDNRLPSIIFQ